MAKKFTGFSLVILTILAIGYGCQNINTQINDDEILYRAKCSSCHQLIMPDEYDQRKAFLYINRYGKGMTENEKEILLNYLTSSN